MTEPATAILAGVRTFSLLRQRGLLRTNRGDDRHGRDNRTRVAGTALAKSGQEKLISGMAGGTLGTSDDTGIFVADTTNNTVSVGVGHAYRAAR